MTETKQQPPLPNFIPEEKPSSPIIPKTFSEQEDRIAEKKFELELGKIDKEHPEIVRKYYGWLLETQLQEGKRSKKPIKISIEKRQEILNCAQRNEKPLWLLTPEERKKKHIEEAVDYWQNYTR